MRTATVLTAAAICGVVAFGSTLVVRAPRVPVPRPGVAGRAIAASGIPPRDLASLERAVRSDPGDFWARYSLGLRRQWAGQAELAREDLAHAADEARNVHPGDQLGARACFVLGECGRLLGEEDGGRGSYGLALRLYEGRILERPGSARLLYYAGWCCRRLGDEAGAKKHWAHAEEMLGPDAERADPERLYTLAAVRALLGYQGQAIGALELLVKTGWRDRDALLNAEDFKSLRGTPELNRLVTEMAGPDQGASGGE
jgi:tetratricopeptide (TPR) repeat protein